MVSGTAVVQVMATDVDACPFCCYVAWVNGNGFLSAAVVCAPLHVCYAHPGCVDHRGAAAVDGGGGHHHHP